MAITQLAPGKKAPEALPAGHFELPDELRSSLHRASDLIRRQREEQRAEPLPTSLEGLDHLLGGGLPRGQLVELVGRGSCGRFAALLAALRAVTGAGEAAALVDQGAQLDPQTAAEVGVDLERLLWLRPENLNDSLATTEILLHTGFPLVALDLGLPPVRGRAPLAAWLRLNRTAATHGAIVLVGSPYRTSGCAAAAVVAGGRGRGRWSGGGSVSRLLNGLQTRLYLNKRRGHADLGTDLVVLALREASFGPIRTDESLVDQHSESPTARRKAHVTAP